MTLRSQAHSGSRDRPRSRPAIRTDGQIAVSAVRRADRRRGAQARLRDRARIFRRRSPTCTRRNMRGRPRRPAICRLFPSARDYGLAGTVRHTRYPRRLRCSRHAEHSRFSRAAGFMATCCKPSARLEQSRQRLDNLRAQIDADVRTALLNIESAEEQVVGGAQQYRSGRRRRSRNPGIVSPQALPTRSKSCRPRKPWPALTKATSPASTPTITRRFLWPAPWARAETGVKEFFKGN